ncbi:MAG: LPP20 family lipoprotein [Deltaproteobacteria bacterium]|nr:LPP20 family lipoprotein [Deltaproteobacteria bacterium]
MPRRSGQICATGAVDPTFFRQDGRVHAAESARNELARTIQVQITSVMYDEQSTRGGQVDQSVVTEVTGSITEAVISGAEIVEYWYDENGDVSRAGMTYAMACMSTDASVAELAERMKAAMPDEDDAEKIEAVRQRAKAAFDALEAEEQKRADSTRAEDED